VEETRRVVVQRGDRFETAVVVDVGPAHVHLRGGWTEGGFGPTTILVVENLEVEARVTSSAPGEVTLRPAATGPWPPRVQRALDQLGRKPGP
jgi:hypothetical protein